MCFTPAGSINAKSALTLLVTSDHLLQASLFLKGLIYLKLRRHFFGPLLLLFLQFEENFQPIITSCLIKHNVRPVCVDDDKSLQKMHFPVDFK